MKKFVSVILAVLFVSSSFAFSASALTPDESKKQLDAAYNQMFDGVAGDVNKDNSFNAADARSALLYSAGLSEGAFDTAKADLDGDGRVTAIDARLLLRVSARLESESVLYSASTKLNLFNAILNDVKASDHSFRKNGISKNLDVTYDNKSAVNDFSKQINSIPGVSDDDKLDFGAELTANKGDITYVNSPYKRTATENNFSVVGQDFASKLTVNDISSIVYNSNVDFEYQQQAYSSDRPFTSLNLIKRSGIDSLTVYLAPERISKIPNDTTTLRHGKCFDVMTEKEIMDGFGAINSIMDKDMQAMVEELGGDFTVRADFNYVNYRDSYITVYFDSDTHELISVKSSLTYDCSNALYMDIYMPLMLNFRNKTINIVNTDLVETVYCFIDK